MNKKSLNQQGQALILITLAIVGLVAMVGIALDGGNVLADRRQAQNTADTSALSAALAKIGAQYQVDPPLADNDPVVQAAVQAAAQARSTSNGYDDNGNTNTVTINNPPQTGCGGTVGPYFGNSQYIQVIIESNVDTYFAPVVGIDKLYSCVEAVARAEPGVPNPLFYGNAMGATACTGSPTIEAKGSSTVTTIGGGVFSNSSGDPAVDIAKLDNLVTPVDEGITAVGTIDVPNTYGSPTTENAAQIACPLPEEMLPKYTCDDFFVDIPDPSWVDSDSDGYDEIPPGVHCITGDFDNQQLEGDEVTIIMLNKGIQWSSNSTMRLTAPTSGSTKGLLIYLPPSNDNQIKITGNPDLDIIGSVFAPSSPIILQGNFSLSSMESQWIGYTLDLTGNVNATITYNTDDNYEYSAPPTINIIE